MSTKQKKLNKLDDALDKLAKFALSHKNIIEHISQSPVYNDEPKLFTYNSCYKAKDIGNSDHSASGVSFDKKRALIKVIGESIERYCLDNVEEKRLITAKIPELNSKFLNPFVIPSFSKEQLSKKMYQQFIVKDDSIFRWIDGIVETKKILIPFQLISTNYRPLKHEPWIRYPISTGAAAGQSFNQAIYTAICECIERDAFMVSYLNELPCPRVDLLALQDDQVTSIVSTLQRYRLEINMFDITTDIDIPVFAAVLIDRTGGGPAVTVGTKAGFNTIQTIVGAIEESLMTRSWIRDKFIFGVKKYKLPKFIKSLDNRAFFWVSPEMIHHLDFWLHNVNSKKIEIDCINNGQKLLDKVSNALTKAGMNLYYVDITAKEIRKEGFVVIKVFIPELYPLYFDEDTPYFGVKRLYEIPVKLGVSDVPSTEAQLNKIPHPFL